MNHDPIMPRPPLSSLERRENRSSDSLSDRPVTLGRWARGYQPGFFRRCGVFGL